MDELANDAKEQTDTTLLDELLERCGDLLDCTDEERAFLPRLSVRRFLTVCLARGKYPLLSVSPLGVALDSLGHDPSLDPLVKAFARFRLNQERSGLPDHPAAPAA